MTNADTFADFDGAYVLGALSPVERDLFEAHLIECADCRARVAELADLPGLLALAPASAFSEAIEPADPVLPLIRAVQARRRRRRWVVAAVATAAAACLITATALIARTSTTTPPRAASVAPVAQQTMNLIAASAPIHATAEVTNVAWGTSIRLHCTYDSGTTYPAGAAYTLTVQSLDGQTDDLGTWALLPGKVMTFTGGTAIHKADIKSITVGTASGTPLLQLTY